jgi:hypothetical protein
MKKFVLGLILSISICAHSFSQTKGIARVIKILGVEVYALSEPIRSYETLFDVETGAKAASLITGGVVNEGVSDKLTQFVN